MEQPSSPILALGVGEVGSQWSVTGGAPAGGEGERRVFVRLRAGTPYRPRLDHWLRTMTSIRTLLCCFVACCALPARGLEGRVRTQAGGDFRGRVRWDAEGITLVDAESRLWVRVSLQEILYLWLGEDTPADWTFPAQEPQAPLRSYSSGHASGHMSERARPTLKMRI